MCVWEAAKILITDRQLPQVLLGVDRVREVPRECLNLDDTTLGLRECREKGHFLMPFMPSLLWLLWVEVEGG